MTVEVRLPQWGMGMTEGTIVEWLCAEGQHITAGDDLVEIDTAKATKTLESPESGVLKQILAQPGEVVEVRAVIALIEP